MCRAYTRFCVLLLICYLDDTLFVARGIFFANSTLALQDVRKKLSRRTKPVAAKPMPGMNAGEQYSLGSSSVSIGVTGNRTPRPTLVLTQWATSGLCLGEFPIVRRLDLGQVVWHQVSVGRCRDKCSARYALPPSLQNGDGGEYDLRWVVNDVRRSLDVWFVMMEMHLSCNRWLAIISLCWLVWCVPRQPRSVESLVLFSLTADAPPSSPI